MRLRPIGRFASRQRTDGPLWRYENGSSDRAGLGLAFHTFTTLGCLNGEPTQRTVGRLGRFTKRLAALAAEARLRAELREAAELGAKNGACHSDAQRLT